MEEKETTKVTFNASLFLITEIMILVKQGNRQLIDNDLEKAFTRLMGAFNLSSQHFSADEFEELKDIETEFIECKNKIPINKSDLYVQCRKYMLSLMKYLDKYGMLLQEREDTRGY